MPFDLQTYLRKYSDLLSQYDHLKVRLIDYPDNPYNLSIASARTCYSSKGLVFPEDMEKSDKSKALRDKIAQSTLEAGHVTTRQHAHFVFGLEGVSRNIIWQFLHAHPYYNSEQVSQRYVPVQSDNWYSLPHSLRTDRLAQHHEYINAAYRELTAMLEDPVSEIYFGLFRSKKENKDKYKKDIQKKAMEAARYIMPLSTTAYLYHTISSLTFYRYVRMMERFSPEAIALVLKMAVELNRIDSLLVNEIPEPLPPAQASVDPAGAARANSAIDERLKKNSLRALLVSSTPNAVELLADMGACLNSVDFSGDFANNGVDGLIDSEQNNLLADVLYPVTLDERSRLLNHIHFTFLKKLSHTADSQEQRHRTLPGSRPNLARQISLENDYIVPAIMEHSSKIKNVYEEIMNRTFDVIRDLYKNGPASELTYLLPNAFPVRFYESGDYLNFFHKWKSRLCYNAQEEIFYSALDEVKQVEQAIPEFKGYIGPPCALRKNTKPRCPEGDRYCGVKVWKLKLEEYSRII